MNNFILLKKSLLLNTKKKDGKITDIINAFCFV